LDRAHQVCEVDCQEKVWAGRRAIVVERVERELLVWKDEVRYDRRVKEVRAHSQGCQREGDSGRQRRRTMREGWLLGGRSLSG